MFDLSNISTVLPEFFVRQIWKNINIWRYIVALLILQSFFCKKNMRFLNRNERKIEKDKSVFVNSDLIITETFFKEFLIELSINETFHKSKYEKIKDFCNYFEQKENNYSNNLLKELAQDFCVTLADLLKFLDEHFFEIHIPEVYRLYPDLKHDQNFNYSSFQEQLYRLCKKAEHSYSDYLLTLKAKLSV